MVHALIFERTFGGRLGDARTPSAYSRGTTRPSSTRSRRRGCSSTSAGDGWEPLCRFLGVPVPDEDFPHLNDTAWYRARTGLPAIEPHR